MTQENGAASLNSVEKIRLKPLHTDCVNTIYTELSLENIMINGVEGLLKTDEIYTVDEAIVNINRPAVYSINQCSMCIVSRWKSRLTVA